MKVVHISHSDCAGGAAIAAYRHHEAMNLNGIDSSMITRHKGTLDKKVEIIPQSLSKRIKSLLLRKLLFIKYQFYATWSWNKLGNRILNHQLIKEADIIILHWINGNTLSINNIESLLKLGKPVFWYMHDMWPLTGGCHHSLSCDKYKTHCYQCPHMHQGKGSNKKKDISFFQFNEKLKKISLYKNLQFITPSQWLANRVKESALFKDHKVKVIPNPIDTDKFIIRDKQTARRNLNLPQDKKLILFGADNISSPYKGWDLLKGALQEDIPETEVVILGNSPQDIQSQIKLKVNRLGSIKEIDKLIDVYNACDVFVTPSLADNYPNVIIEANACGLPVVGTNIGGISEMIENNVNGIKIKDLDSNNFRDAIIFVLNNSNKFRKEIIRTIIESNNSYEKISETFKTYIGLTLSESIGET